MGGARSREWVWSLEGREWGAVAQSRCTEAAENHAVSLGLGKAPAKADPKFVRKVCCWKLLILYFLSR